MNIIVVGIIACEIGFWVMLGGGLGARYLLRLKRLSSVLLLCVPLLDLLLLAFITWDLVVNGATADFAHGLGAVYLGFTVAFGHQIISRADGWFAHRFAGGPPPFKAPKSGPAQVRYEWEQWGKMLLCAVIATAVIGLIVWLVGDSSRTEALIGWIGRVWLVTGIWFVGWPVWVTLSGGGSDSGCADPDRRSAVDQQRG
ncbi:hypothetical protein [Leucobacter sp. G161]|uniref:hypothetical protein n=1 Tax=Leucobacter sp. G161 TaxID=663704 RepID=UPI000AE72341|nr:hypothetical protein [Leucobacter sp. G161]